MSIPVYKEVFLIQIRKCEKFWHNNSIYLFSWQYLHSCIKHFLNSIIIFVIKREI